ncbi:hypothetical protein TELCIR_16556 [Teladorsagia circumcincta]|uniref:Uncharacterized protein n=1 Tax=Teladorsagia circumcincta TaxID=45464 RepID=A0A2G9TV59_TELCI|nr:hypothetical protein TELCIR_16556 [Teladorsagia circumcincta]
METGLARSRNHPSPPSPFRRESWPFARSRDCVAIASCGFGNYTLETAESVELSSGVGLNKLIECSGRRWMAVSTTGTVVDASSLRCVIPAV